MASAHEHPLFRAIEPLLAAIGGEVVDSREIDVGDIPLTWDGTVVGAVRMGSLSTEIDRMITLIEAELGGDLSSLGRVEKQAAVRMLDERGAFQLRKSIEDVADRMGVSRITIYSYLNAIRDG